MLIHPYFSSGLKPPDMGMVVPSMTVPQGPAPSGDVKESKEILKLLRSIAVAPDIYSYNSVLKLALSLAGDGGWAL